MGRQSVLAAATLLVFVAAAVLQMRPASRLAAAGPFPTVSATPQAAETYGPAVPPPRPAPTQGRSGGGTEVCVASWYAGIHGMVVAHRTAPRGSRLRVTSRETGKAVIV